MLRSERGQSLVELALVLPLLLLLFGGIVDLGRVFYTYIGLTNATREGARTGARQPWDAPAITSATETELANSGITGVVPVVECQKWSSTGNGASVACVDTEGGDYITVSATHTGFDLVLGAITGVDALTITGRTRMSIQGFKRPS
jgi:Flp pilus assembly protein TadG